MGDTIAFKLMMLNDRPFYKAGKGYVEVTKLTDDIASDENLGKALVELWLFQRICLEFLHIISI